MEDTTVTIIGMIMALILMFVVPIVLISDRSDDISQLTVQTVTADFINKVIRYGKITESDYNDYTMRLASSGNSYDVDIELKILDDNPARYHNDSHSDSYGTNAYYSIFTSQIISRLGEGDEILLKEGDIISIKAQNNSKTLSQSLKSVYYTIRGEDLHIIASTDTQTAAVTGTYEYK